LVDNGHISGSATSSLTINNVQTSDASSYQLVVTNLYGTDTSTAAVLTVLVPAYITNQPTNQIVSVVGANVAFTVAGGGTAPLNYLWYANGVALTNGGRISGATSATLSISNSQTNDSASYYAIVTNNYGFATSSVVRMTVYAPVQITGNPASQAVLLNSNATLAVTAAGSGPLNYQWYFNGALLTDGGRISGSATPALTITHVQTNDAGGYVAVVTNLWSAATSRVASLTPQSALAPSVRYVSLANTNPLSPYLDWSTAATNIQDANDAAVAGDTITVTDGVYNVGSRAIYNASNRVAVDKAVTLHSLRLFDQRRDLDRFYFDQRRHGNFRRCSFGRKRWRCLERIIQRDSLELCYYRQPGDGLWRRRISRHAGQLLFYHQFRQQRWRCVL